MHQESSSQEAPNFMKFKCLVANDDDMQLSILESIFQNAEFEVHLARNGFEAL